MHTTLSRIQFHVNGNSFKYNEAHRAQCFQQRMTHFTHFSPQNQPNRLQIVSKKKCLKMHLVLDCVETYFQNMFCLFGPNEANYSLFLKLNTVRGWRFMRCLHVSSRLFIMSFAFKASSQEPRHAWFIIIEPSRRRSDASKGQSGAICVATLTVGWFVVKGRDVFSSRECRDAALPVDFRRNLPDLTISNFIRCLY